MSLRRRIATLDRSLAGLVSLTFAVSLGEASIVPLLPMIKAQHGLTGLQTGAVLSATTVAMLVVSLPAGMAAARVGPRRVLVAAVVLLAVGLVAVSLAPGLGALLAARAVFGLAAGTVWTIAPVLAAGEGRGARGTGWLVASAGAGWLVGPVSAGVIAGSYGAGLPFLILGLAVAPLVLVPVLDRSPHPTFEVGRLRAALGVARRERAVGGATIAIALLGGVSGAGGLLAPIVLAGNGLSVGAIGLLLGLAAVVFTASGVLATRLPAARIDVRLVGTALLVLALTLAIPAVSLSTGAIVAFLLVSAACRALLNTAVYALARMSVPNDALAAPVTGVMNTAWASMALAAPIAAGLAIGGVGARFAFAVTAAAGLLAAVVILMPRRLPRPVAATA